MRLVKICEEREESNSGQLDDSSKFLAEKKKRGKEGERRKEEKERRAYPFHVVP